MHVRTCLLIYARVFLCERFQRIVLEYLCTCTEHAETCLHLYSTTCSGEETSVWHVCALFSRYSFVTHTSIGTTKHRQAHQLSLVRLQYNQLKRCK